MTEDISNALIEEGMILQPLCIAKSLYPHQRRSVFRIEKLEEEKKIVLPNFTLSTTIGVYADKTGYGKTLGMITAITRDKMTWDKSTPHFHVKTRNYSDSKIQKTITEPYRKIDTTLILISSSIIKQWEEELKLTPLAFYSVIQNKHLNVNIEHYDVILIIPSLYNEFVTINNTIAWKRFIFDEPSTIKVPAMKSLQAGFIWLISATPYSIANNHKNCKTSFMHHISYEWNYNELIDFITIKNSDDVIAASYNMPISEHKYIECYSPIINIIRNIANPKIIEMIEMGNIKGAIKQLGGGETTDSSSIVSLLQQKKERDLRTIRAQITLYENIRPAKVQEMRDKETRILSQIRDLESRYSNLIEKDCPICQDKIKDAVTEPECQNVFCGQCLLTWLQTKGTCPLCRCDVRCNNLIYINTEGKEDDADISASPLPTKEQAISKILEDLENRKIIIFSQEDNTFTKIRKYLTEKNINFVEVKGTVESKDLALKKYKTSKDTNVLFLNSKYNDSGLNLQETTDIILYHTLNENTLKQVLGRANRIGRTSPLTVHHLIYQE